jgi:hypothetical protein
MCRTARTARRDVLAKLARLVPRRAPASLAGGVPTRDSAEWIEPTLDRYAELELGPTILLDSTSRDATERIVRGRGLRVHAVTPSAPRVEAMLSKIAAIADEGWGPAPGRRRGSVRRPGALAGCRPA